MPLFDWKAPSEQSLSRAGYGYICHHNSTDPTYFRNNLDVDESPREDAMRDLGALNTQPPEQDRKMPD